MKITSKGQVTIPLDLRTQFGFLPNTDVEFIAEKGVLKLVKPRAPSGKGKRLIEKMRGRGNGRLSTNEIMKLTRGEP
jgi:bifunctional DNA-binding transcriptional regulator/antitoxin component of YhaV-PrlF toxin-antitoxin module